MMFSGWRLALAVLAALVMLTLLIAVALWVAIGLGVVGAVVWLNLVVLPRLSRRLHLPRVVLDAACLVLLVAAGWLANGPTGLALGALAWLAGVAGPRVAARRLAARARGAAARPPTIIIVDSPSLTNPAQPGRAGAHR